MCPACLLIHLKRCFKIFKVRQRCNYRSFKNRQFALCKQLKCFSFSTSYHLIRIVSLYISKLKYFKLFIIICNLLVDEHSAHSGRTSIPSKMICFKLFALKMFCYLGKDEAMLGRKCETRCNVNLCILAFSSR